MEKYMPSKKFKIFLLVLFGIILVVFLSSQIFSSKTKTVSRGGLLKLVKNDEGPTLQSLFEKDRDGDGLKDWEEGLWGTDPDKKMTFENTPDNLWVENKKRSLTPKSELADEDLNQTEQLSRELYSTLAALKAGGVADQSTIYSISSALGSSLANSELSDEFNVADITLNGTGDIYLKNITSLLESYDETSLGTELVILKSVLNQKESPEKLNEVGGLYKSIAETGKTIGVPPNFQENHLKILNNAWKTGMALESLSKTLKDPLSGMIGLVQYQKYSELFLEAVEKLNKIAQI